MNATEFNRNFEEINDLLFGFAMKLTKNRTEAKDLIQETALRSYSNIDRFKPGTNFKAWVTTIMRNSFINDYRKKRTRNRVEKPADEFVEAIENTAVRNEAHSQIMITELQEIINTLSDAYREPFTMFYEGFQYNEIAEKMNLPMGTVKSRIFFARKQIKDAVAVNYGENRLRYSA